MIVGITGAICAGKYQFAQYLAQTHGFEAINFLEIFKLRLIRQRREIHKRREARQKKLKAKNEKQNTNAATAISTQQNDEDETLPLVSPDEEIKEVEK